MGSIILLLAFMVGLVAGPIVVAHLFPRRSSVQGNVIAGESGVSTVFWGASLGLAYAYAVLAGLIIADPIGGPLPVRFQLAALLFAMLGLILAPMTMCGFHKWRWDAEGLEFKGALSRRRVRWIDIADVRQHTRLHAFNPRTRSAWPMLDLKLGAQHNRHRDFGTRPVALHQLI